MAIMQGMKRIWKTNSEFAGKADAETVQKEIDSIAAQDAHGKCSNEALVEYAASHPNSESYKLFEWDDTKAAKKYRIHQAGKIKCEIVTIVTPNTNKKNINPSVPVYIATNHALPTTPGNGHKNIEVITQSPNDMDAFDKAMFHAVENFISMMHIRYNQAPSYILFEPMLDQLQITITAASSQTTP